MGPLGTRTFAFLAMLSAILGGCSAQIMDGDGTEADGFIEVSGINANYVLDFSEIGGPRVPLYLEQHEANQGFAPITGFDCSGASIAGELSSVDGAKLTLTWTDTLGFDNPLTFVSNLGQAQAPFVGSFESMHATLRAVSTERDVLWGCPRGHSPSFPSGHYAYEQPRSQIEYFAASVEASVGGEVEGVPSWLKLSTVTGLFCGSGIESNLTCDCDPNATPDLANSNLAGIALEGRLLALSSSVASLEMTAVGTPYSQTFHLTENLGWIATNDFGFLDVLHPMACE